VTDPASSGNGRSAQARPPAAEAERVSRSFGTTQALDDVTLSVLPGECHALVGRNGAGKSTLVGILTGMLRPDRGAVRLHGEPAPGLGDREAWRAQVACVYQRSMVIPSLTVAENVFLNRPGGQLVRWRAMRAEARRVLREWEFELDVDQAASGLSVEEKQVVEIARALSTGARFLILDEPTASLESAAIERLFERVRRLKESGVGVLYISHHLEEIFEICDSATVLRDGRHILTSPVAELDDAQLVAAMVGAALARSERVAPPAAPDRKPRLRVEGLCASSSLGEVEDVGFAVAPGECLGLFGLRGSGIATVADAIVGLVQPSAGSIAVDGEALPAGKVDVAFAHGVGYVPEDRHARGFVPLLGVAENLTLPLLDRLSRFGLVSGSRRDAAARRLSQQLEIVARDPAQPVGELSGGNQQKVVVGRALALAPDVLVVVSPTVGVDVASKEALLTVLEECRDDGAALVLVSDDLEELRICTRLLVVVRGRVMQELHDPPWDRHRLIAAAEGLRAA
jgi:simple sugar transport system ATP-binding protein